MSDGDPKLHYTIRVLVKRQRRYTLHVYNDGTHAKMFTNGGNREESRSTWTRARLTEEYHEDW